MKTANSITASFTSVVRALIERRIAAALHAVMDNVDAGLLAPGKMLRSRLAARLLAGRPPTADLCSVQAACGATELVHTASLCHDDVVDNSMIRRSLPTLWQAAGSSGAILIGDLLLCQAIDLLAETDGGRYLGVFIAKVKQVVQAEAEQELLWRGQPVDEETCLRLARDKTGPLFAFTAMVCGGQDKALCAALEEAGYRIGTAYQLADDLLDVVGDENAAGKTLGTDRTRGKLTLPQTSRRGRHITFKHIEDSCRSSLQCLEKYSHMRDAMVVFLTCDLQPVLNRHIKGSLEIAV